MTPETEEGMAPAGSESARRIRLEEAAALYALGALDDERECVWLTDLIANRDPETLELLDEMLGAATLLAGAFPEVEPHDRVEAKILERIRKVEARELSGRGEAELRNSPLEYAPDRSVLQSTDESRSAGRMRRYFVGVTAVLALLLFGSMALVLSKTSPDEKLRAALMITISERDSLFTLLEERGHFDSVVHVVFGMLQDRSSRFVVLAKTSPQQERQHIFWSPAKRMVVVMREKLGPIEKPKVYGVWEMIPDKSYVGVGSFTVDPKKPQDMFDFIAPSDSAKGFAISMEPDAMGSQPKGPVLFAGLVPGEGRQ